MNKILSVGAAILMVMSVAICPRTLEAGDSVVVVGTVKEVTAGEKGGRILAEVLVEVDSKGDRLFFLRKESQVSFSNKQPATWLDLKSGHRVRITYGGVLMPARPPQASADAVVIETPISK